MQDANEFDPRNVLPPSDILSKELIQIVLRSINRDTNDECEDFIDLRHAQVATERGAA